MLFNFQFAIYHNHFQPRCRLLRQTDSSLSPAGFAHVVSKSNIITGCSSNLKGYLITLIDSCLFVLLLYFPSQQLWSWWDGQFTLPHFFLGKLEQAVNQYFVQILLLVTDNLSSMNQRKGGECL